jgi:(p)ppGpp synthase/HD superfamily hydrolase
METRVPGDFPRVPQDQNPETGRTQVIRSPEEEQYELWAKENRKSFLERFKELSKEQLMTLEMAYDLAKEAHRPQVRDTGERYFEHLRNVALILVDECNIKDAGIIIAALCHDSIEDSGIFGNRSKPHSEWKEQAYFRLSRIFDPETANMIITLTKPKADGEEIKTEEEAHHIYIEGLKNASNKTILVKMADRLHNLRTLPGTPRHKQIKIVKETNEVYFPIFEQVKEEYPQEGAYMIEQMKAAINNLRIEEHELA